MVVNLFELHNEQSVISTSLGLLWTIFYYCHINLFRFLINVLYNNNNNNNNNNKNNNN